jgi:hypothetical protein
MHLNVVTNTVPKLLEPVKVKLSLCLTNQALSHEGLWGSGCIEPHFDDLSTSWRCGQFHAPAA